MTPGRERPREAAPRGPLEGGHLTDRCGVCSPGALARRRGRREAEAAIAELRRLLDGFDSGEIPFDMFACVDVVTGRLADLALAGLP